MRVADKQSAQGTELNPSKPAADRSVVRPQADKVSLEATKVDAMVQAVQAKVRSDRSIRLEEIESAIRRGGYQLDAGRLAERIVQAAEVDARLRAIFGG